jgi:hypothetical protein
MARRGGKPGQWLAIDQYTGMTRYASQLKRDRWGSYAVKPLLYNPQEQASPLNDPQPVALYTGSAYEQYDVCDIQLAPRYVGNTTVLTSNQNMAMQVMGYQDGIPNMEISCNFEVA